MSQEYDFQISKHKITGWNAVNIKIECLFSSVNKMLHLLYLHIHSLIFKLLKLKILMKEHKWHEGDTSKRNTLIA